MTEKVNIIDHSFSTTSEKFFASTSLEMPSVAEFVRRWGSSTSVALLDPECKIFSIPEVDGIIGYQTKMGCAIVFGDPVCHPDHLSPLVNSFKQFCQKEDKTIVYAATSKRFAEWTMLNASGVLIEVAEELILDPQQDPLLGSQGRRLRSKISPALNSGVTIHEYLSQDLELEKRITDVGAAWLENRDGPQIYLANVDLFSNRIGKRWFYAKKEEQIIGILLLNELESHRGWVLNLCMTVPDAPKGTSEFLVVSTLKTLKDEGCALLTVGSIPRSELGEIIGIGPLSSWVARKAFKTSRRFFQLEGRSEYWKKFHPKCEERYVVFDDDSMSLRAVFGLMKALNASL